MSLEELNNGKSDICVWILVADKLLKLLDYIQLRSSKRSHHCLYCCRKLNSSNWSAEKWLRTFILGPETSHAVIKLWPLTFSCQFLEIQCVCFKRETKGHSYRWTYPVHLHVLKLEAKVIPLYEVASQENIREEGLSKSFLLKEKTTRDYYFHHCVNKEPKSSLMIQLLTISTEREIVCTLFWQKKKVWTLTDIAIKNKFLLRWGRIHLWVRVSAE